MRTTARYETAAVTVPMLASAWCYMLNMLWLTSFTATDKIKVMIFLRSHPGQGEPAWLSGGGA